MPPSHAAEGPTRAERSHSASAVSPHRPRRHALKRLSPLQLLGVALLCAIALVYLYPLFWLADSSFRAAVEIFQYPPLLFRDFQRGITEYTLGPMTRALTRHRVGWAFGVTAFVALCGIALTLVVCSLCAYAMAYIAFPGRQAAFAFVLGTMMLPTTTMTPAFYRLIVGLGLRGTLAGVIFPSAVSAFGVFLLRQYFIRIPRDTIDAAKVDGASHFRIWWSIILPLSRPALAALAIVQFRAMWNDFLVPLLVLDCNHACTLAVQIAIMDSNSYGRPYDSILAAGFLSAATLLIVFVVFQRQFIEGLAGGMKA